MKRNWSLDYVKTMAIITILFYHMGFLTNGYLGVECFFVISGFLFVKSNSDDFKNHSFNPFTFILKKISSFWPLVLASSVFSLIAGYIMMLPDDFENLSESVIASLFFSNNFLQCITTKNYWAISNLYKPLMHTWYIAVLLQSFIFLSVIIWIANKLFKRDVSDFLFRIIFSGSLILYLLPFFSDAYKFYLFPFRLFEICIGACIARHSLNINQNVARFSGSIGYILLAVLLFSEWKIPGLIGVLVAVFVTSLIILTHASIEENYGLNEKTNRLLTLFGRYSYDIYIWHQVLIAFLYYSFFQKGSVPFALCVIAGTSILSVCTVLIRNQYLKKFVAEKRVIACIVFSIPILAGSFLIYQHAGVVRDVPELEIDKNNIHRGMFSEYVDIPYGWDKDFTDPDKIHILVLGDSFGRDFANILNESQLSDRLEISYRFGDVLTDEPDRVENADYIFYCASIWWVPDTLEYLPQEKLYVVGNKSFGNSNGIIYANRNKEWYFDQKVQLDDDFFINNYSFRGRFGSHYIDMISPLTENNKISVFTDDNFYISQDCKHLTRKGAQYYARILDLDFIQK